MQRILFEWFSAFQQILHRPIGYPLNYTKILPKKLTDSLIYSNFFFRKAKYEMRAARLMIKIALSPHHV